jgi:hypothetical protein
MTKFNKYVLNLFFISYIKIQRVLFSFLFVSLQVSGAGSRKTQPCSWIFQNPINWDYPFGAIQGSATAEVYKKC